MLVQLIANVIRTYIPGAPVRSAGSSVGSGGAVCRSWGIIVAADTMTIFIDDYRAERLVMSFHTTKTTSDVGKERTVGTLEEGNLYLGTR